MFIADQFDLELACDWSPPFVKAWAAVIVDIRTDAWRAWCSL